MQPWIEDTEARVLRVVPTPNGPRNLIKFRSGHGSEGKVWPELVAQINSLYDVYNPDLLRENVIIIAFLVHVCAGHQ